MLSDNHKMCISMILFSSSIIVFMIFMFCNIDFGLEYNLVFLTVNIVLIAIFFMCIFHYYTKSRSNINILLPLIDTI